MRDVAALTRRNLRLFFRDRLGVFFSLLSAIVLIGLYALFLGQNQVDALADRYPRAPATLVFTALSVLRLARGIR